MVGFYQQATEQRVKKFRNLGVQALAFWDLKPIAELELLSYRENVVYKLITGDGDYALKIHRAGYHSNEELRSEMIWMEALSEYGFATPEIIRTRQGDPFAIVESEDVPDPCQVDIVRWINGTPLNEVAEKNSQLDMHRYVGELMARLHNHTSQWIPPEDFTRFSWDDDGLLGENPIWGRFWELEYLSHTQRETILKTRDVAKAQLQAFGQHKDRYGLIHCDLLPQNLLKDEETVRIIDFDDCGYGWHMFDIATYMFLYTFEANPEEVKRAFIEGYRRQRDLSEEQLQSYDLFMLIRVMTYCGWVYTRPEAETAQENAETLAAVVANAAEVYLTNNQ
ncbi:MAG: phosphotransferase [Deltaproteobacteria bacterium]|nr:phosphotransferase [Deltaproteobacteria bacterium]